MAHVRFYRRIKRFTGGHLKVWDYYQHVISSSRHTASVRFARGTVWGESNPWSAVRAEATARRWSRPDVHFVAGFDWTMLPPWRQRWPRVPVINLVQHVRHADPDNPLSQFLSLPAVRICVSEPVADALAATGRVKGPLLTIPAGLDLGRLPAASDPSARVDDLVVVATKQPALGDAMYRRLASGRAARLIDTQLPRNEFLEAIGRARVALFVPNPTEGFYLPALEAMALDTLVVCPDVVGNRGHWRPGINSLGAAYEPDALVAATEQALTLPAAEADRLRGAARETAAQHDLRRERDTFLTLLDELPALWREVHRRR
jgi:glycosyltransferase involved in cell wall biosynthesis